MLLLLRLIYRNLSRHRLRTVLTLAGLVVAVVAFALLRTVVIAWYAGVDATSATRLITRNAISLIFPLPISYVQKIRQVPGVTQVAYANWFGAVYIDEKNFFPQFAIEPHGYLALYPEYRLNDTEYQAFLRDRQGCIIGAKLARQYGFKVGDQLPLVGKLYPGTWNFVIRGIYRGADVKTDETMMFFHWGYLNERLKRTDPTKADRAGVFVVEIARPAEAAAVSTAIDAQFKNSLAETLTETEKAFQLSFVAMTETILGAVEVVSFVVIIIIMAVMANTMAMNARERTREYATLKALGFGGRYLTALIFGEALILALSGALLGIALSFPVAGAVGKQFGTIFPVFHIAPHTVWQALGAGLVVGMVAGVFPTRRAIRLGVADGLRQSG